MLARRSAALNPEESVQTQNADIEVWEHHIETTIESASRIPETDREALIVVVGGLPGVEAAGEVGDFVDAGAAEDSVLQYPASKYLLKFPVAFASASSRWRFSCSALRLASAFGVCFLGWCTGQVGSVQTFRSSPLSIPSDTMASVVYLQVLNSGHFAFSGVSGLSSLISTYLLRGMAISPSGCCLYAVLIWTSPGLAATFAFTCASSLAA
jgi:hypothetical protein